MRVRELLVDGFGARVLTSQALSGLRGGVANLQPVWEYHNHLHIVLGVSSQGPRILLNPKPRGNGLSWLI